MTDELPLLERLRTKYCCTAEDCNCDEAADRIEAQAAEIERLVHDLERQMTIANEHVNEVEAYKQKVGDIAAAYNQMAFTVTEPHLSGYRVIIGFDKHADASVFHNRLVSLLDFLNPKPKPDPLINVAKMLGYYNTAAKHLAGDIRAALAAAGFEIREKNDD